MPTEFSAEQFVWNRVVAGFDARTRLDAGALLLRGTEGAIDLIGRFAQYGTGPLSHTTRVRLKSLLSNYESLASDAMVSVIACPTMFTLICSTAGVGKRDGAACFSIAWPMLMRLSAITPSPTQRCIPASPLYLQRSSPCRRLTTLMRPSHPVRHFCPLRNQRFFCSRLRSGLLVERLGMQTRLTPIVFAVPSFLVE
jgi:hypothetical protein